MNPTTDLYEIAAIRGWYYVDGRELELEPGYVMGWTDTNSTLGGSLYKPSITNLSW